jgi:hypothetical protein
VTFQPPGEGATVNGGTVKRNGTTKQPTRRKAAPVTVTQVIPAAMVAAKAVAEFVHADGSQIQPVDANTVLIKNRGAFG